MTVEQAIEAGKELSFDKVWAMFAEVAGQMKVVEQKLAESAEQLARLEKAVAETTRNVDGVNRSLGKWTEYMVAAKVWEKFDVLGYVFTKGAPGMKFRENRQTIAEAAVFLENGDYVMPIETKSDLTNADVDEHIKRIEKIRLYMDNHNDKRTIVGAVGGAIVPDSVCRYAQKKGLYVLVPSGESVAVAEIPQGFTAKEW